MAAVTVTVPAVVGAPEARGLEASVRPGGICSEQ
jgi:hypothetical protein